MRLQGKVALVTGGSRGIGRAIVKAFAAEGAKVAIVYRGGKEQADNLVQEIRQAGGTAEGGVCDVAVMESVKASIASAVRRFGGLHILINAAGLGRFVRFEEMDEAEWQRVIAVTAPLEGK